MKKKLIIKPKEKKLDGIYSVNLPEKEYQELIDRAIKENMPAKQWRKEIKEIAINELQKLT